MLDNSSVEGGGYYGKIYCNISYRTGERMQQRKLRKDVCGSVMDFVKPRSALHSPAYHVPDCNSRNLARRPLRWSPAEGWPVYCNGARARARSTCYLKKLYEAYKAKEGNSLLTDTTTGYSAAVNWSPGKSQPTSSHYLRLTESCQNYN